MRNLELRRGEVSGYFVFHTESGLDPEPQAPVSVALGFGHVVKPTVTSLAKRNQPVGACCRDLF